MQMGWHLVDNSCSDHADQDCRCEYYVMFYDDNRAFSFRAFYETRYTKRCEKHEAEDKELANTIGQYAIQREIALNRERAEWEAERPQRIEQAKQHLLTINNITTINYTDLTDLIKSIMKLTVCLKVVS